MTNDKGLKVLIVDDDKNICDLLRLYLEKTATAYFSAMTVTTQLLNSRRSLPIWYSLI